VGDDGERAGDLANQAAEKLRSFGIEATAHGIVSVLSTSDALLELGRELGASFLVMGAFAHSRLSELLDSIVRALPIAVDANTGNLPTNHVRFTFEPGIDEEHALPGGPPREYAATIGPCCAKAIPTGPSVAVNVARSRSATDRIMPAVHSRSRARKRVRPRSLVSDAIIRPRPDGVCCCIDNRR